MNATPEQQTPKQSAPADPRRFDACRFDVRRFDAHMHVLGDKASYVEVMDAAGIRAILNISFGDFKEPEEIAAFEERLRFDTERFPGRFYFCTSFNITHFEEPDFTHNTIVKLTRDFEQYGAAAVKIWKDLGMMLKDREGRWVFCDDARFTPVFDFLTQRQVPIVMHIADPKAAWMPLDPASPHYGYYKNHPEFHWYGRSDVPSHDEILGHRDELIRRYPETSFVCAHLGSLEHDVDEVATFLDKMPNANVDVSARIKDLRLQPAERVRALFAAHSKQILYGTDWDVDEDFWGKTPEDRTRRITEAANNLKNNFRYFEEDLQLEGDILKRFYCENAKRIFRIPLTVP